MFALVDCNNFFASCEMVFNPGLEKKPLVILSNNDGCIIARSAKAKALGIKMGEPAFLYRDRKDIQMLSSNFALYADMSRRVMQTLSSFSPDMEIYSIDEAFFYLEEENLLENALSMRRKVERWTGIKVSIGLAKTKTLAKLASAQAKRGDGVALFEEEQLKTTGVGDIWGIGRRWTEQLKRKGIYTAEQLKNCDDTWIRKLLGVTGFQTVLELRGISCLEVEERDEKKKSLVVSRSFGKRLEDLAQIQEAVASFAGRAAEKLRAQESRAGFLSVYLVADEIEAASCHIQIPTPTSYTPALIALAKQGVAKAYRPGIRYKKAGVLLGEFSDEQQQDFITPHPQSEKREKAMAVLDEINAHYNKQTIHFAAQGTDKTAPWRGNKGHRSPNFTTDWNELLKVK